MAGYTPVLPPQKTSGYPYIAYGDLDKAAEVAKYNVRRLSEALGGERRNSLRRAYGGLRFEICLPKAFE
jgi:Fe-S oxidoreductase